MTDSPSRRHPADLVARDRKVLWHPFANLSAWEEEDPPVIVAGDGSWLIDETGKRFLDGTASLWVNLLGHRHPALDQALKNQLGSIAHSTFLGATHEPAILLAEKLRELAPPGLTRVFYSDNGSTAVEIALKLSFLFQRFRGKKRGTSLPSTFFSLERSYHGDTLGAVGVGGIGRFHQVFGPLIHPSVTAPAPDCFRCPEGLSPRLCHLECADLAARILEDHRPGIAGVILEPLLQAAGGLIVWPPGYLGKIAGTCRNLDLPLILDEVATGFGRTGTLFACEQEGVVPDFLVTGKALTGGYLPLAATLMTEEIYEAVKQDPGTFYHGHSYTANPLGCQVALAALSCLEEEDLLASIPAKREKILGIWKRLESLPCVVDIRSIGLVAAFDLRHDDGTPVEDFRILSLIRERVRKRGMIIRPLGPTLYLIPPLSVTLEEVGQMAGILAGVLEDLWEEGLFFRTAQKET
jgi:adenosylmethionine-8-amino-7-oxononanoate aminotransferase